MARTAKRYQETSNSSKATETECYYVGIYSRLSVDNHDRKAESVENQIEIIHQFICENNAKPDRTMKLVVYDTYIDRGISGTSFQRSGFERLMQNVREQKVTCIIVKDLSRFGRDYLETGNLIEKILPFLGCRFIAVADHFDSMAENADESKLAMNIKNLVNDMYARDISKRISIARKMAAERGSYIGGEAPYGYQVFSVDGIRTFQVQKDCADVVQQIFRWFLEGFSIKEMILKLYEQKVHRISDYKKYGHVYCKEEKEVLHQWNAGSIYGILHNSSYLGKLEQGKTRSRLYEGKKGISYPDREEWIVVENTFPAIINKKEFEAVQSKWKKRGNKKTEYRQKDTENIYRNLIYCGNCGKLLHAVYYQCRTKDERHYSYLCRDAYFLDERKCEKNYIREEQITALVRNHLCSILKAQKVKQKDLTRMNQAAYEERIAAYALEEKKIAEECEALKRQAGILYGQYKEGLLTREEYLVFQQNKKEQDAFAEKRREEIKRKIRKAKCRAEEESQFLRSLLKLEKSKKLNIQIVESLIEKISVFPDGTLDITYNFSNGGI